MEKIFPTFSTLSFLPSYVPANLISNEKNSFSQFQSTKKVHQNQFLQKVNLTHRWICGNFPYKRSYRFDDSFLI